MDRQQRHEKVLRNEMKRDPNTTGGLFGVEKKKKIRVVDPDELKAQAKAKQELEEREAREKELQEKLRVAREQDEATRKASAAGAMRAPRSDDRGTLKKFKFFFSSIFDRLDK